MAERALSAFVWAGFALAYSLLLRFVLAGGEAVIFGTPEVVLWFVLPPLCAGALGALLAPAMAESYRDSMAATAAGMGCLIPGVSYLMVAVLYALWAVVAGGTENVFGSLVVIPLYAILFLFTVPLLTLLMFVFGFVASYLHGWLVRLIGRRAGEGARG